jgi:hypothetical protein
MEELLKREYDEELDNLLKTNWTKIKQLFRR